MEDGAEILAKRLSEIYDLSITSTTHVCKVAKLKPIFKKGKKTDPSHFRPISLLPLVSKVLEEVIHDQTNAFLKNDSTNLSLSFSTNKILKGFHEGLLTGMILIDLQKAFNTINLLKNRKAMGFSERCITWFLL